MVKSILCSPDVLFSIKNLLQHGVLMVATLAVSSQQNTVSSPADTCLNCVGSHEIHTA